ncbi:DIP2C isoform 9, partial [Pan troglodytes]
VSQYKVRDTFCSYSVMELCTKGLGSQTESLKARGLDLSRVRTCVVVAEERPRIALTQSFSKLFKDLGLHPRAVSTSFGCRVNLAICLQYWDYRHEPPRPAAKCFKMVYKEGVCSVGEDKIH